ncbi:MAG TPA: tetratricopeptide repeat protein [Ktedonobacteraceae bacterium]|nr:tetratricopeptide repeat protein [Ktedonobacteraceae bacterium]
MPAKKEIRITLSPEDEAQVQQLLAQYHQIATNLHGSQTQDEVETAISDIDDLTETAQMALLKALARETNSDAADVLQALHELSPNKAVRKEAKRGLIRLESSKIYPRWEPPVDRTLLVQLVRQPPRFWKGYVTQSREEGEVQLILTWEEGYEYNEVRMMSFLLDFWEQGVKDFVIENFTKRSFDEHMRELQTRLSDITLLDATLAEGRRLIEDALSVNKWRGTAPHKEYRHHLPTINQLILEAPNAGEDRGETFINPSLEPDEVAATFTGAWGLGDYALDYDMLSSESRLREGLERDEWIERRRNWVNEAHPTRIELSLVREREPQTVQSSGLWVPTLYSSRSTTRKEVELIWSLEVGETPLSGTLPEMPMGTIVYKEIGRHWYWTVFTLAQEGGRWRIQSISDEGANVQGLSIEELQKRIEEENKHIEEVSNRPQSTNQEEVQANYEEAARSMLHSMFYDDALLVKLPLDQTIYEDAFDRAMTLGNFERAAAYLDRIAQRFGQGRAEHLQRLGILQSMLAESYQQRGLRERSEHFFELAESTLSQALAINNTVIGHVRIAEILINHNSRLDEAETHLNQARELAVANASTDEQAMIEADLGSLSMVRDQPEIALRHFQRAAELNPALENVWFSIGMVQRILKRFEEAEATFKHAMEVEPRDFRTYAELAAIYMNQRQYPQARETLEQGIRNIPASAYLRALLASVFLESGDRRHAQAMLEEAERINPQDPMVQAVREEMAKRKR